jgi:hypothetical protein
VSEHDELRPITEGDVALMKDIEKLPPGSIIYSENAQWGYVLDAPAHVQFTSIPTLGLVQLEESIQAEATSAVFSDRVEKIQMLNITHAVSSPIGTVGWYLGSSAYWTLIAERDGSALWAFDVAGNGAQFEYASLNLESCTVGCDERVDPWRNHRFRDPIGLGDTRAFVEAAQESTLEVKTTSQIDLNGTACVVFEAVGDLEGLIITLNGDSTMSTTQSIVRAGWHSACMGTNGGSTNELVLDISWASEDDSGKRWVNPLGISGRSDALLDRTGIRLHWLEFKQ